MSRSADMIESDLDRLMAAHEKALAMWKVEEEKRQIESAARACALRAEFRLSVEQKIAAPPLAAPDEGLVRAFGRYLPIPNASVKWIKIFGPDEPTETFGRASWDIDDNDRSFTSRVRMGTVRS